MHLPRHSPQPIPNCQECPISAQLDSDAYALESLASPDSPLQEYYQSSPQFLARLALYIQLNTGELPTAEELVAEANKTAQAALRATQELVTTVTAENILTKAHLQHLCPGALLFENAWVCQSPHRAGS